MSKLIIISLLIVVTMVSTVFCARSCNNDQDCGSGDCCIEYFPYYKRCKDKGDDHGDRCGGQFYCESCAKGLSCVEDMPSIWNYVKLGKGDCVLHDRSRSRFDDAVEILNLR